MVQGLLNEQTAAAKRAENVEKAFLPS